MRIDEGCVEVDFACNCMTFDGSSSKLWYHEEYLPLDDKSYAKHKETMTPVVCLARNWS